MRRKNQVGTVYVCIEPDETAEVLRSLMALHADKDGHVELEFECSVSPYDPGRLSGPPENCYPPEGGELEDVEAYVVNGKERVKLIGKMADDVVEHFQKKLDLEGPYAADEAQRDAEDAAADDAYDAWKDRQMEEDHDRSSRDDE